LKNKSSSTEGPNVNCRTRAAIRHRHRPISLKAIIDIAKPLGISVHDHIIVGKSGHASLRGMRLI